MRICKVVSIILMQSALLLQAGCSHFESDKLQEGGIKEGPGLFSGEKGYFEL